MPDVLSEVSPLGGYTWPQHLCSVLSSARPWGTFPGHALGSLYPLDCSKSLHRLLGSPICPETSSSVHCPIDSQSCHIPGLHFLPPQFSHTVAVFGFHFFPQQRKGIPKWKASVVLVLLCAHSFSNDHDPALPGCLKVFTSRLLPTFSDVHSGTRGSIALWWETEVGGLILNPEPSYVLRLQWWEKQI